MICVDDPREDNRLRLARMVLFRLFFSFLFVLVLLKVYALSMRVERRAGPGRRAQRDGSYAGVPTAPAELGAARLVGDDIERDAAATEAILVAQRLAGDLGPAGYQRAMAELATKDTRHPVIVPRDPAA
jgi:hypothetical protein